MPGKRVTFEERETARGNGWKNPLFRNTAQRVKKAKRTYSLDIDIAKALEMQAARYHKDMSVMVCEALRKYLSPEAIDEAVKCLKEDGEIPE